MIRVTISTENAAFQPFPGQEAARLLRRLADRLDGTTGPELDHRIDGGKLLDVNGNTVGEWESVPE